MHNYSGNGKTALFGKAASFTQIKISCPGIAAGPLIIQRDSGCFYMARWETT